jgi:hypothetical protein
MNGLNLMISTILLLSWFLSQRLNGLSFEQDQARNGVFCLKTTPPRIVAGQISIPPVAFGKIQNNGELKLLKEFDCAGGWQYYLSNDGSYFIVMNAILGGPGVKNEDIARDVAFDIYFLDDKKPSQKVRPDKFGMSPKNETSIAGNREWWDGSACTHLTESGELKLTTVDGNSWSYNVKLGIAEKVKSTAR